MAGKGFTRRQMLMGAAPVVAALPMAGMAAAPASSGRRAPRDDHAAFGHAAMIGARSPRPAARTTSTPC